MSAQIVRVKGGHEIREEDGRTIAFIGYGEDRICANGFESEKLAQKLARAHDETHFGSRRMLAERPKDDVGDIILCHLLHNDITPFVTWFRRKDDGSTSHGNYFGSLRNAMKDFDER